MAGEQKVDALLESLTKLKEQLGTLHLDREELRSALASSPQAGEYNSLELLKSLVAIREGSSQKAIIDIMLRQIAKQCRGCGMVLLSAGSATFWIGPGFGLSESEKAGTQKLPVSVQEDSLVRRAAATGDAIVSAWPATDSEEDIYRTIGMGEPSHFALIPMTINGRVQAVILADVDSGNLKDPAAMAIIVATAATTIEHLPFRDRIGFSRFPRIEESPAADTRKTVSAAPELVAAQQEVEKPRVAEPAPEKVKVEMPAEEPAAPASSETVQSYSQELEAELGSDEFHQEATTPTKQPAPLTETAKLEDAEFEIEVTDEDVSEVLEDEAPAVAEEEAAEIDASDLEEADDDMNIDFLETPELIQAPTTGITTGPMIEAAREKEEEAEKEAVEEVAASAEESLVVEEPAAEEMEETVEAEPAAKTTEVNYEAFGLTGYDLDKYDGDVRKKHEKAIRFARLLVSEIKLYNEDAVKLGRENGDLLSRLKDDITRSEALYKQRISAEIREQSNYFHAEMIRQLAEGNESLLGD